MNQTTPSPGKSKRVAVYIYTNDTADNVVGTVLQMDHFSILVSEQPDWILEGVYADIRNGKPAYESRSQFDALMAKCREGKIDLIVTKSVFRFSKSLAETLHIISELAALPVPVNILFETQNLITPLSENDRKNLAMLSALDSPHSLDYIKPRKRRDTNERK